MNKIDNLIGILVNYYKLILVGIGVIIIVRIIIDYRKKITSEYICPNCKTLYARSRKNS